MAQWLQSSSPPAWVVALALLGLWATTFTIAAEAWMRRVWIGRYRAPGRWDGKSLGPAVIFGTAEGQGPVAVHRVEQRGRLRARPIQVQWHDRGHESLVYGGAVRTASGRVRIPETPGEVWPRPTQQAGAGQAWTGPEDLQAGARRAKGILRNLQVEVVPGTPVFVMGSVEKTNDGFQLGPLPDGPVVVATFDPVAWADSCRRELTLFALFTVGCSAVLTVGALYPPAFGLRSALFAAAALLFFLLIQPAGVWMRGRTVEPAYREVAGTTEIPADAELTGSSPR